MDRHVVTGHAHLTPRGQRLVQVDARKRLTVAETIPGALYTLRISDSGTITLEPAVVVTLAELRARRVKP